MTKTKRKNDSDASQRIADFVRGRKDIPRAMLLAAFPRISGSQVSLLSALGHVEKRTYTPGNNFAAYVESRREERKAAKVAKLEAELAKLRTPTAG